MATLIDPKTGKPFAAPSSPRVAKLPQYQARPGAFNPGTGPAEMIGARPGFRQPASGPMSANIARFSRTGPAGVNTGPVSELGVAPGFREQYGSVAGEPRPTAPAGGYKPVNQRGFNPNIDPAREAQLRRPMGGASTPKPTSANAGRGWFAPSAGVKKAASLAGKGVGLARGLAVPAVGLDLAAGLAIGPSAQAERSVEDIQNRGGFVQSSIKDAWPALSATGKWLGEHTARLVTGSNEPVASWGDNYREFSTPPISAPTPGLQPTPPPLASPPGQGGGMGSEPSIAEVKYEGPSANPVRVGDIRQVTPGQLGGEVANARRGRIDPTALNPKSIAAGQIFPGRSAADINADIASIRGLRNAQRAAEGKGPVGSGPTGYIPEDPTMQEALQSYASGDVRSQGYGMMRNLMMQAKETGRKNKPTEAALAAQQMLASIGSGKGGGGADLGDFINVAKLQDDRSQNAFENKMSVAEFRRDNATAAREAEQAQNEAQRKVAERYLKQIPDVERAVADYLPGPMLGQAGTLLRQAAELGKPPAEVDQAMRNAWDSLPQDPENPLSLEQIQELIRSGDAPWGTKNAKELRSDYMTMYWQRVLQELGLQ
jgi:hypothetical protein